MQIITFITIILIGFIVGYIIGHRKGIQEMEWRKHDEWQGSAHP